MRILVASDRIGALSSRSAGQLIASGWQTAQLRVVPVGESGEGFVEAYADASGVELETVADATGLATVAAAPQGWAIGWEPTTRRPTGAIPSERSSLPLGQVLRTALERRPARVYIDLSGPVVHDAGAGALAALGAGGDAPLDAGAEPLARLKDLDLAPARELVGDTELIGVVPGVELSALLLGLRGITSRLGREHNEDPARMLAIDSALERFATLAAPQSAGAPGAGAGGGLGFAVLALGGRLVTGPSVTLDTPAASTRPDLVLTGCSVFDFARRGGGVVAAVAGRAAASLAPCVVLAGEVFVGSREMRAMGIEAAYAVRAEKPGSLDDDWSPTEAQLGELAHRVARTWQW